MTDTRKVQLQADVDASTAKPGFDQIKRDAREMARDVGQAGAQAGAGLAQVGASGEAAARKLERESRSMAASIQRATAVAQAGERGTAAYFEAIAKQRGVSVDALKPYLDQLRAAEAAQKTAAAGVDRIGISARQTAAALRQVPAQFTDIVTALAAGQNPMQVFLQQGGQLKDVFGGAGAAARALGGYVAGLITPVTLAGGAVAALVAGYAMGSAETAQFTRDLVLSGHQAGLTAAQVQALAVAVAAVGSGTQGRAAEVLLLMARSSAIGADNLQRYVVAALELQRVGGPAAEETAKAFADLGKAPLEAAVKLNESTNFLTRSTYDQIRALQEQGKNTEAARVAQTAYAQSIEERAPVILQQLGLIERAWLGIKEGAAGALDAWKNIGRGGPVADLESLRSQMGALQRMSEGGGLIGAWAERQLATMREQEASLQEQLRLQGRMATAAGEQARQVQARAAWDKDALQYLDKRAQAERAIAQAREEGLRAGATEAEIAERVARIRQNFDSGENLQRLQNNAEARIEIIKRGEAEIEALRATGVLNERGAMEARIALALRENEARQSAVRAELALVKSKVNSEREAATLEGQLALLIEQRTSVETKGRLEVATAIYRQKQALDAFIRSQQEETAADRAEQFVRESKAREAASLAVYEYGKAIADEGDALRLEVSLLGESERARATRLAQYRIEVDLKRRIAELDKVYYEGGDAEREIERQRLRAAADQAKAQAASRVYLDEMQRANDQIAQSLTDALMRGGKNAGEYLKDYFRTLVLRPVIQAAVQPFANAINSLLGSVLGGQGGAAGQVNFAQLAGWAGAGYARLFGGSANAAGTMYANATGTGLDGLLATNGAYGTASGSGSAAASSASSAAGWAAIIAAGLGRAERDYDRGWTRDALDTGLLKLFNETNPVYSMVVKPLEKMGLISEKWADILSATPLARAFGRKAPELRDQGVTGSFGAGDFSGQQFADWTAKGGWFRSDKSGTNFAPLDEAIGATLDSGSKAVLKQVERYAQVLGLPAERLTQITSQARIVFTGNAEEDRKAIEAAVAEYGKALAGTFTTALTPFKHAGEEVQDTLQRLAGLQDFSASLHSLGGVFATVATSSVGAREALIEMAGGMDTLLQQATGFVQNYYSRDEVGSLKARELQDVLRGLGITQDVSTKDQFRQLVSGTDVSTTAGQERLVSLLQIQAEFAQVADYLAEVGTTLSGAASQAPLVPALEKLFQGEGMKQQIDAINGVTDAVQRVEQAVDRLTDKVVISPYTTWTYQEVGG